MSDNPEAPPPAPPPQPAATRGMDYRIIFANHSRMRVSATELSLTFGFVDEVAGAPPFVQELVTMVLTPQHAKLLALSLTETVKLFEQRFGSISTEQSTTPPFDSAMLQEAMGIFMPWRRCFAKDLCPRLLREGAEHFGKTVIRGGKLLRRRGNVTVGITFQDHHARTTLRGPIDGGNLIDLERSHNSPHRRCSFCGLSGLVYPRAWGAFLRHQPLAELVAVSREQVCHEAGADPNRRGNPALAGFIGAEYPRLQDVAGEQI